MEKSFNIWMITKWYPNTEDPQFGIFIQKHARAISRYNKISVLYIHSSNNLSDTFMIVENETDNLNEVIIYFRKIKTRPGLPWTGLLQVLN